MAMLDKIRKERMEKVEKLRKLGINPYPANSTRDTMAGDVTGNFSKFKGKIVTVSGRMMSWRDFGGIVFAKLRDASGEIQLYMKKENMPKHWDQLSLYDVGDFVDAKGKVTKSKTGEISVEVNELRMLSKAIRPLPEKWAGLKDDDVRFRKRYLDFLVNPESKEKISKRGQLLQVTREFMYEKGFIEIENPSLEINPAGAESRPFITHMNAYDLDVYLRICIGELWQKMSTIGGFEKVFEIGHAYRNEGVDAEHNPEFTMMEFYWAYATIEDNINLHQELFAKMAEELVGGYKFKYHGKTLNLTPPYRVAKYNDLLKEYAKIDLEKYDNVDDLIAEAKEKGVEYENGHHGWSTAIDQIFKQKVRPQIFDPVFVVEYPYILTPLAKRVDGSDRYVQMSQLVIDSMEMCRIYGELNDPIDQMERFKEQQHAKEAGDEDTWGADYEFVEAMEYGMPPQSGSGIGIDRCAKILTDAETLRDVIAYPLMKPETEETQPKVQVTKGKLNQDFDHIFKDFGVDYEDIKIEAIDGDEYLSFSDEFKKEYPSAVAGYVIIDGVEVKDSDSELDRLQSRIVSMLRGVTKSEIDDSSSVKSYREMYKNMGVDWHSRRPSPEALLRRISHGKDLYSVNTMVDAYNLAVITQQVSSGAFDLSNMVAPITLGISKGGDKIELIGGETKDIAAGEVAYYDKKGAYNIDYNYRDSERTKITHDSRRIIINAEGIGDISYNAVLKALKLNAALLMRFCGGKITQTGIIRSSGKAEEFPYDDQKITVVVADDLDTGIAMNTVGHLTTSIGKFAEDIMGRESHIDASGVEHVGVPRYPVIILKASRTKVRELVGKAREAKLLMVDYPAEIFETRTEDDLHEAITKKKEEDIDYYGVALCGSTEEVDALTKGLSLYK